MGHSCSPKLAGADAQLAMYLNSASWVSRYWQQYPPLTPLINNIPNNL